MEAFVEAFVEAPVQVTYVEACTDFIFSMEASVESSIAFISSMEAFMEAVKATTEPFMSFHVKCKSCRRPRRIQYFLASLVDSR